MHPQGKHIPSNFFYSVPANRHVIAMFAKHKHYANTLLLNDCTYIYVVLHAAISMIGLIFLVFLYSTV
jgi:hypothetical protein